MPQINLKSAQKAEKTVGNNLLERIYRLQVIKQLIRERHMAHSAEEYNESEFFEIKFRKYRSTRVKTERK